MEPHLAFDSDYKNFKDDLPQEAYDALITCTNYDDGKFVVQSSCHESTRYFFGLMFSAGLYVRQQDGTLHRLAMNEKY